MKTIRLMLALTLFSMGLVPAMAMADSITPDTVSLTLNEGESATINKTVTITKGAPTTAKVDVFFLCDTTGSMGGVINNVKTNAATILGNAAGLGDVAFGVGEYKDVGDVYVYRKNTDMTKTFADVQTGINAWGASGGGDLPEADLYALKQVSDTTAWRPSSTRILVWFGDAPGHDPSLGVSEADATAALQAKNIVVEAVNVGGLDSAGQATRITAATGGSLFTSSSSGDIVTVIDNALKSVFTNYNTVSLDTSGVPAGVGVSVAPGAYSGAYDRSVDRTFDFTLTLTGAAPGTYTFPINALVDGGIVATERDDVTVGSHGVPEPSIMLLLSVGVTTLVGFSRRQTRR